MKLTDNRIQQILDTYGGGFTVNEWGENRGKLNPLIVREVTRFRQWHGFSSFLTSTWRPEGAHAIAAADMVLYKDWKESQPDYMHLWRLATTWPWFGIGIYNDWSVSGESVIGLHVDLCEPDQRQRPLRWIRDDGVYYYQSVINGKFYDDNGNENSLDEAFN